MRVEVVRDIRIDTSPRLKCFELELGLGHVCTYSLVLFYGKKSRRPTGAVEVEVSKLLSPRSGIIVGRVKSLVAVNSQHIRSYLTGNWAKHLLLNKADQTLFLSQLDQLLVILNLLGSRLGDHDVVSKVKSFRSNREMGAVGGEDDHS